MTLTKEQAYERVGELVGRFREHLAEYKRIGYNEQGHAECRIDELLYEMYRLSNEEVRLVEGGG